MENKRIVEINGVKVEVDLSTVKVIDEYKVGDNVKVLHSSEYQTPVIRAGVITEFVNFKELPTIVIAELKTDYLGTDIDFVYYNSQTKGVEITPCLEHDLKLNHNSVVEKFERMIATKRKEADELQTKLDWFNKYYNKYFNDETNA